MCVCSPFPVIKRISSFSSGLTVNIYRGTCPHKNVTDKVLILHKALGNTGRESSSSSKHCTGNSLQTNKDHQQQMRYTSKNTLVKDKQGNLLKTDKEQEIQWTEHFQELLNGPQRGTHSGCLRRP